MKKIEINAPVNVVIIIIINDYFGLTSKQALLFDSRLERPTTLLSLGLVFINSCVMFRVRAYHLLTFRMKQYSGADNSANDFGKQKTPPGFINGKEGVGDVCLCVGWGGVGAGGEPKRN